MRLSLKMNIPFDNFQQTVPIVIRMMSRDVTVEDQRPVRDEREVKVSSTHSYKNYATESNMP